MRPDTHRWIRSDAARFLPSGVEPASAYLALERKYNRDQPRVPAGNRQESERWTDGGESGAGSNSAQREEFSPDRPGWRDYQGENLVCPADLLCTRDEIADQFARFSVPGRDPSMPVENQQTYEVFLPGTNVYVGSVWTEVSDDGLTVINRTLQGRIFFDGMVERRATQTAYGAWYVTTRGIGNNVEPGMNIVNQVFGPDIFDGLDQRMRTNIELHHGQKGFLALARVSRAAVAAGHRPGVGDVAMGAKLYV